MPKAPEQTSLLDRLQALDEERRMLLEGAKEEALAVVTKALEGLNTLGFNYSLVERGASRRPSAGDGNRKGTRQVNADRLCPICQFKTDPPHDARRHRGQEPKKAFTETELEANHMSRV